MNKVLCSTGALIGLPNNRDYTLLENCKKHLNCDGFEFMIYSSWYDILDTIGEYLISKKFFIPVVHCEKHVGEKISIGGQENLEEAIKLFRINCDFAQKIGTEKLVLHLWDGTPSDQNIENNYSAYKTLNQIALEHQLTLMIENVVCNNQDPFTHWLELCKRYPEISFIFDTKMAAFHCQEEEIFKPEYKWLFTKNYIKHFHINDYAGGFKDWANLKTLPIGKGHVNFEKLFAYLKEVNYSGDFTVEATAFRKDGTIDFEMLNDCFEKIRNF